MADTSILPPTTRAGGFLHVAAASSRAGSPNTQPLAHRKDDTSSTRNSRRQLLAGAGGACSISKSYTSRACRVEDKYCNWRELQHAPVPAHVACNTIRAALLARNYIQPTGRLNHRITHCINHRIKHYINQPVHQPVLSTIASTIAIEELPNTVEISFCV